MWPFRRRKNPAAVVAGLRALALASPPADRAAKGSDGLGVVMMDFWVRDAVVTLATFADRTASLYFSTGGGILGRGNNPVVILQGERFRERANERVNEMERVDESPYPGRGRVRFTVRTTDGLFTADADEDVLGDGGHPLSPLFEAGHEVITVIRQG